MPSPGKGARTCCRRRPKAFDRAIGLVLACLAGLHSPSGALDLRVSILASGSSGNAILVSSEETHLLVDAGISARRVAAGARAAGVDPDDLAAVVVTHEHSDHVSGLGPVARRFGLPVYATGGTHDGMRGRAGTIPQRVYIEPGREFRIGELSVVPFVTSHDCAEPVGFSIADSGGRLTVATDLGLVSGAVRRHLRDSDCVVLEFNHDEQMLRTGAYPWRLKKRIASNVGHLSNVAAAAEIAALRDAPVADLVLAHLSEENNVPELAVAAASEALSRGGRRDVEVHVAEQRSALGPIEVRAANVAAYEVLREGA
ncbi:MAG: MBL fold metallo-hydrolase [Candidatus Eisenbacteria bacterium]|nr:MBL fold metallo-hydrolase [Candidatus Eisenbacteria bacterium]